MQSVYRQITIPPELEGRRLDQALAQLFPDYSRSRIKDWILAGQISVDGASAAPRTKVVAGQQISLMAELDERVDDRPEAMDLDVVFEDPDLLVIDKPAGLVVHPGAGNPAGTLVNGLLYRFPELGTLPRAGLVHRLDKDTSGLLVVARSLAAHTALVRDLQAREMTREYRAVCVGRLTAGGSVNASIDRHPTQRTRMAVVARGRPAVTHYRVLQRFQQHSFLAVRLDTGRTHQIRVHMTHIGHPLVGDAVYGERLRVPAGASEDLATALREFRRQALHASRLELLHPVTRKPLRLHAPLPPDMVGLLSALDGGATPADRFDALTWPDPQCR